MILRWLRTSRAFGETPRTCTLASVPVERRGKGAITTTSGVTSGPSPPRATPGASSRIRTCSRVTLLSISEVEPARRTIALPNDPEETSVALNPLASESMATKTPTVPAIPRMATMLEIQRSLTLRRLYTTGMAMSYPPQRVHNAQAHGADRRHNTAGHAHQQRDSHACRNGNAG